VGRYFRAIVRLPLRLHPHTAFHFPDRGAIAAGLKIQRAQVAEGDLEIRFKRISSRK
jgi:hypothetical protein